MMSTGKSRECLALRGSLWLRAKRVKDKEILGFGGLLLWGELLSTERMWALPELNPQITMVSGQMKSFRDFSGSENSKSKAFFCGIVGLNNSAVPGEQLGACSHK